LIRERSVAGTNRRAGTGEWLGGVVPYGYRKEGEKGNRRLVISEDPILGIRSVGSRGGSNNLGGLLNYYYRAAA
jgi:hypothetical protein